MKFHSTTLGNGLTVIGEEREGAVSTAAGFFVRTGARDETPEVSGVSHFLEHMMFKGTAKRSALDITYGLSALGAQSNAFTSEEMTVYYAAFLPEYLAEVFDILSDMLRPALDPHEFDTEKKVILEEIALYKDRPSHVLFESSLRHFYSDHPAGNSVLGSIESITALSAEQMRTYFDRRYSAANIVLAISGNFEWDGFVELASTHCGSWVSGSTYRDRSRHAPTEKKVSLTKGGMQTSHLCLVAPGPSATEEERFPLQVLSCILGDSSGSRAFWEIIDKGLADNASIDTDEMDSCGMVYCYASAAPEDIDTVCATLREILRTPKEFTNEDLERAKTKLRTRLVLQGESSMRRLMAVGSDWLYRGEYVSLESEVERLGKVSRSEIEAALERYALEPLTEVRLTPS